MSWRALDWLPRASLVVCSSALLLTPPRIIAADSDVTFNPAFFDGPGTRASDISRFEHAGRIPPGTYQVDLFVNQQWSGREEVRVLEEQGATRYCLRRKQLPGLGLDLARLAQTEGYARAMGDPECVDVALLVPQSRVELEPGDLRLDLSIPQLYLSHAARGYVDPRDWDRGVTAAFFDYDATAYRSEAGGVAQEQDYLGLDAGLNLGDWRLRHRGSYQRGVTEEQPATGSYSSIGSYMQRDLGDLKAQLTLGESSTVSPLFDSLRFTGLQLASDERMLPDSQRGFAPQVQGTAETNAQVIVRQQGQVIRRLTVAPGPFVIDDLQTSGNAGDLEVTVREADGRERHFTVPFAAQAQLLRPGSSRYSLALGRYRDERLADPPRFLEASYQRGLSNLWSGYTGSIIAEQYLAVQAGMALSTSLGAVSLDLTRTRASGLPSGDATGGERDGQVLRLGYSTRLPLGNASLSVAAYRANSAGYMSLAEFASARAEPEMRAGGLRNRLQVRVNQPLGERLGSFYFGALTQDSWGEQGGEVSYQAGYSNNFSWGSLSLSASRARESAGVATREFMLNLAIPLGTSSHSPFLDFTSSRSSAGTASRQLGLSGALGEHSQFGYSFYGASNLSDGQSSGTQGGNLHYRSPAVALSYSQGQGEDYRQSGLGASGSVLLHPGGINFSAEQGETRALVEAPGAGGAGLGSRAGVVADNGYGVVAGLTPYRENPVVLDPKGLPASVELEVTEQKVAPHYGAVVLMRFPTLRGTPLLLHLLDAGGGELPLGAEVLDAEGASLAVVGQGSLAFLHARQQQAEVQVRWGEAQDQQCQATYQLAEDTGESPEALPFVRAEAVCRDAESTATDRAG